MNSNLDFFEKIKKLSPMTILATDILPHICEHLTHPSELGKLARASKSLNTQIMHHIHAHWLRIGKAICGEAFWREELFGCTDGRYIAMLHLCPWLSIPERLELDTLKAYSALSVTVELQDLKVCCGMAALRPC